MKSQANETFFDEISEFYDGMINFQNALKRRREVLSGFLKNDTSTVADLGCGSGLDSISLAQLGLNVTGFDQSAGMINQAAENSQRLGLNVVFQKSSLNKIPRKFDHNFDMAFSLGNTLANLKPEMLASAIRRIYSILKDNGSVVIQILNYHLILKKSERIINITGTGNETFIRFYDFFPEHLNFNILKFRTDNPKDRTLFTTRLYPHTSRYMLSLLKANGFTDIKLYGNLQLSSFLKHESSDLVILARK